MFETFRDWPTSLEKAYPEEPAVNIPALMKEVVFMQVGCSPLPLANTWAPWVGALTYRIDGLWLCAGRDRGTHRS